MFSSFHCALLYLPCCSRSDNFLSNDRNSASSRSVPVALGSPTSPIQTTAFCGGLNLKAQCSPTPACWEFLIIFSHCLTFWLSSLLLETRLHSVAQAGVELTTKPRLTTNSTSHLIPGPSWCWDCRQLLTLASSPSSPSRSACLTHQTQPLRGH